MKKNVFLVLTLLTALYACGVKSAQKTEASNLPPDLAAGHALYKEKCSGCHPAFDVKTRTVDRWNEVLVPMIKDKAKLNATDGKLVEAYVWHELGVKGK